MIALVFSGNNARSLAKLKIMGAFIMLIKKGDIFFADLGSNIGFGLKGIRPVLIIQSGMETPIVIVAAITSRVDKALLPTHVKLSVSNYSSLARDSVIQLEQIHTLDKNRLKDKITELSHDDMLKVDKALSISIPKYNVSNNANYRSQVYISSTYLDLIEERKSAIEAILTTNCIPIGLEMFTANSDDTSVWEAIKSLINKSDIFLLIIGSRYGTLTTDEYGATLSCVEREYNYAKSLGKPILAFCQEETKKTEANLTRFVNNLKNNHMISFTRTETLKTEIIIALSSITANVPLRIMISWSGSLSRDIGILLRELFSVTNQAASVFMGADDIQVGDDWKQAIMDMSASCQLAIICVTSENCTSPWIMYEIGALSQKKDQLTENSVIPLLIDTDIVSLKASPLLQYQTCNLSKEGIYKLVYSVNEKLPTPIMGSKLNELFNTIWPSFEEKVNNRLSVKHNNFFDNADPDELNELQQNAQQLLNKMTKLGGS